MATGIMHFTNKLFNISPAKIQYYPLYRLYMDTYTVIAHSFINPHLLFVTH